MLRVGLVNCFGDSGSTVETQRGFGLGATGPRLLAQPSPAHWKPWLALVRQWKSSPTVKLVRFSCTRTHTTDLAMLACVHHWRLHTCKMAGDSASGVAGGSSLISLRPPTSPFVPILSNACSLRFSLFSIRANACRMASIFLSSRVYMIDTQKERRKEDNRERLSLFSGWQLGTQLAT